jgi:hypothetical protein
MMYYINVTWLNGVKETLDSTNDPVLVSQLRTEYALTFKGLYKSLWIERARVPDNGAFVVDDDYWGADRPGL